MVGVDPGSYASGDIPVFRLRIGHTRPANEIEFNTVFGKMRVSRHQLKFFIGGRQPPARRRSINHDPCARTRVIENKFCKKIRGKRRTNILAEISSENKWASDVRHLQLNCLVWRRLGPGRNSPERSTDRRVDLRLREDDSYSCLVKSSVEDVRPQASNKCFRLLFTRVNNRVANVGWITR